MSAVLKHHLYESFLYFFPAKCAPLVLSRVLGVLITVASSILFLPQIIKIHKAKSAYGISLTSQVLGLLASASTAAYNYEKKFVFGQWGDSLFIALQMIIIIMQILWHSNAKFYFFVFMCWCWCVCLAIAYHYIPFYILSALQASTLIIIFISKGLQIVQNYWQGSTGQLSVATSLMQFVGCIARIFTSIQETSDWLIIMPFILAGFLNGINFVQIIYYTYSNKILKLSVKKKKN